MFERLTALFRRPEPVRFAAEPERKPRYGALVAGMGATAATLLVATVVQWEGTEYAPYRDVVGIWTVCTGDTKNVIPGKVYTKAECEERLERQLIAHARPVMECVPGLTRNRPNQLAASTSLAYNVGAPTFCRSTIAKRFNRGDWKGGCQAFMLYVKAGGRTVQGLVNRRKAEMALCLKGLS